ncbi:MAG: hypothetical protein IJ186_03090 [Bacilli bacterium]|nr:hypothetical protein [Bacilli bacterium]
MKCKLILIAILSFGLSSCVDTSNDENKVLLLDAAFVFERDQTDESNGTATLLFNDSYYSFSSELKIDKPIVAGDQLRIVFNGDYDCECQETYPANCRVEGDIINYSLLETHVIGVHVDDTTIGETADDIRRGYLLDNEYVILDEDGRYTTLDKYDGHDLFLSENRRKAIELCTCPEGALCEECPFYVAGLYAYNPRPQTINI